MSSPLVPLGISLFLVAVWCHPAMSTRKGCLFDVDSAAADEGLAPVFEQRAAGPLEPMAEPLRRTLSLDFLGATHQNRRSDSSAPPLMVEKLGSHRIINKLKKILTQM